jgi:hypothetical protein
MYASQSEEFRLAWREKARSGGRASKAKFEALSVEERAAWSRKQSEAIKKGLEKRKQALQLDSELLKAESDITGAGDFT